MVQIKDLNELIAPEVAEEQEEIPEPPKVPYRWFCYIDFGHSSKRFYFSDEEEEKLDDLLQAIKFYPFYEFRLNNGTRVVINSSNVCFIEVHKQLKGRDYE